MFEFIKKEMDYLFDLVGGILFAAVMFGVMCTNFKKDAIHPVLVLLFIVMFIGLQMIIRKLPAHGWRYWLMVSLVFISMTVWHIRAAYLLEVNCAQGDASVVLNNAMLMAKGEPRTSYATEYFGRCQNQLGYLFLMTAVSKAFIWLTGQVCYTNLMYFNVFFVDLSVLMAVLCAEYIGRKMKISSCGLRTVAALAPAPFLWLMVPYVYTDSLVLPFLVGTFGACIYAIDHIRHQKGLLLFPEREYKDVLSFLAIGALISIGYQIKGNLVVLLVALIMILFIRVPFRKWCELSAAVILGFVMLSVMFSMLVYQSGVVTKESAARYKVPATFWPLMGMDAFGPNQEDKSEIFNIPTYQGKKDAIMKRMKWKLDRYGIGKILRHYYRKATRDGWDSGFFSMDSMLETKQSIKPVRRGILHDYLLKYDEEKHKVVRPWINAYWNALEIFALTGFFSTKKKEKETGLVLLRLFTTGTVLFFMIWEANWRYIFSSTVFIALLAAFQMEKLEHIQLRQQIQSTHGGKNGHDVRRMKGDFLSHAERMMREILDEQMEQGHISAAEGLIGLYQAVGERMEYGSFRRKAIETKASIVREQIKKYKANRHVEDNVLFYLDLWKDAKNIPKNHLPGIIESGVVLRQRLSDIENEQNNESVVWLLKELDGTLGGLRKMVEWDDNALQKPENEESNDNQLTNSV